MALTLTANQISFVEFGSNNVSSNPPTIAATISNGSQTYYGQAKSDNSAIDPGFVLTGATSANITPVLAPGSLTTPKGSGQITVEVCKDNVCGDIVVSQIITYTYAIYSLAEINVALNGSVGGTVQTVQVPIQPAPPASTQFTATNSSNSSWLSVTVVNDVVQISANPTNLVSGAYYGTVEVSGMGGTENINVEFVIQ